MRANGTQIIEDETGQKEVQYSFMERSHFRSWKNTPMWEYSGSKTGLSFSEDSYSCGVDKNGKCNKVMKFSLNIYFYKFLF